MSDSATTALILILHGSPKEGSSEPANQLAQSIKRSGRYAHVMTAFMECNRPTIGEAVEQCVALSVSRIIAVPYLLHTGRHLVLDIPDALKAAGEAHPEVTLLITDPVGESSVVSEALAERGREALEN